MEKNKMTIKIKPGKNVTILDVDRSVVNPIEEVLEVLKNGNGGAKYLCIDLTSFKPNKLGNLEELFIGLTKFSNNYDYVFGLPENKIQEAQELAEQFRDSFPNGSYVPKCTIMPKKNMTMWLSQQR